MDKLALNVSLNAKQYYHFNLYHCYHSFNGILGIFLGLLCIVYGVFGCVAGSKAEPMQIALLFIFGIVILLYNPVALYVRSKRRFLTNPVMKNPVTYIFTDSGIRLKQDEVEEEMPWENLYKIVKTKESMIFYLTRYHANIVPLSEIANDYEKVCAIIGQYADKKVIRFRLPE